MALTTQERDNIVKLAVGMFNAAPGSTYLQEFTAFFEANGRSLSSLANYFAGSSAYKGIYPNFQSAAEFASTFLTPLGLQANTVATDFVTSRFNKGQSTQSIMLDTLIALDATTDSAFTTAKAILNNKTSVATTYSLTNSALTLSALQAVVSSVDATAASVTAANAANSSASGNTFTLTTGVDASGTMVGSNGTTSTAGNDTFTGADTTLNSNDNLNGGLGSDTLNVRATAAATTIPVLTSIETVNISNVSGGAFVLDFISATGTTLVASKDQSTTASVTRAINMASSTVARLDNSDITSEFNFLGSSSRTGTSDAVSLQIAAGSGSSSTASTFRITTTAANTVDATFENLNIATSGSASFVALGTGNASYRVYSVTGDAAIGSVVTGKTQGYGLTLTTADTAATDVRTVNASGMTGTGGLDVDLSGSTQTTVAFTGSNQNDRVLLSGAVANAANTFSINGGSGTNDIMAISTNTDFTAAGAATLVATINAASGIETLEATAAAVTVVNADSFTSINNFVFSGAQTGGHAVSNLRTGDTLTYTADSTRAGDTLTLSGGVAGQTLGLTLTGGVDIAATGAGNAMTFNSGVTTVNLVSANPSNLATSNAVNTITAATTVAAIDNTSAVSFIVTGSAGLTIGAVAALAAPVGFSNAVSVDASALTGVLRIAGSTGADQIKGGSGADIIYGIDGNDELTGNGGADQFRFLASTNGTDTIKDFTIGTDKIGIADAVINVAGVAASAAGTQILSTDYEIGRNDISAIVAGDTLKVIELQTALTSAQIAAQVSAGAADAIILVFNSTTGKGEMWYDSTWADATADGTRVQLATFDNITSLVGVQAFTVSEFMSVAV